MSEEVIELSVQETNKLRAELGLAPLRVDGKSTARETNNDGANNNNNHKDGGEGDKVLEMSVDDTNALRAKLGLPPLRESSSSRKIEDANLKGKQREEDEKNLAEAIQLEDDVQRGIKSTFTAKSLGDTEDNDVSAWAAKLRSATGADDKKKAVKKTKKSQKGQKKDDKYDEEDLKGINVSHAMSELEAGSTTVMTLADAPLLESSQHNPHLAKGLNRNDGPTLENVNLAEQGKQADGLKKKRQLELGMGRAGGYAGFDDDEFAELGGTGAPSRSSRRGPFGGDYEDEEDGDRKKGKRIGFQIGQDYEDDNDKDKSDLFAMEAGKAISLEQEHADVQAADFMTEEEYLESLGKKGKKEKKKKDKFAKLSKKDRKEKKKNRRKIVLDDDEESDRETDPAAPGKGKTLLDVLEETAEDVNAKGRKRSRAKDDEDGDVEMEEATPASIPSATKKLAANASKDNKRAKYEAIMEKGNVRTAEAYERNLPKEAREEDNGLEEEPDDAFLNAALAKARRLKKLREMSGSKVVARTGADAVIESLKSMPEAAPSSAGDATSNAGGMTFAVDDTREFTRALLARSEQKTRKQNKDKEAAKKEAPSNIISTVSAKKAKSSEEPKVETVKQEDDKQEDVNGDDDADMAELSKEIKEDDDDDDDAFAGFLDGTTGSTVAVGRGLSGVLNLFKQTGDLTRKNAGKEELRGRAKDERTYEDYEKVDLKSVVKIDDRRATDKDREMAAREVKLEYRDKDGRLLTRKEAYRDLCYQFHGHGSSKRKEEKRMKQMAREQAETRLAAQQLGGANGGPGMLGALKATQKATGKAFVVHKT